MWISSKHHGRGCETQTSSTQRKLSVFDSELCQHNITSVHSWMTLFHSESSSAVTLCSEKVLTLSHSGRWNTLGGRAQLNPCAHTQRQRKKKTASSVSLLLFPVPLTAFMNCPSLHTFVSFVLTLKPGVHLLLPSHCLSVFLTLLTISPPRQLAALKSSLLWQGSPSRAWNAQLQHLTGHALSGLSKQLIGCHLSQCEAAYHRSRWANENLDVIAFSPEPFTCGLNWDLSFRYSCQIRI